MGAEEIWKLVQGVSTIAALLLALKALRKDQTQSLVLAIFADERWEKMLEKLFADVQRDAREAGRIAAADRVQVLINPRDYMPRELQEKSNEEFERRLKEVERKIDNVPRETAKEVMLIIREREAARR